MKIYLVRHGETDWNKNGILIGQKDIPLNKNGKDQALLVAKKLAEIDFDVCYSSPLIRAKETAEIICRNKTKIIEDVLLMERDCGVYSGRNKCEIDWNDYDKNNSVESDQELFKRAEDFARKIKQIDAKNILVVSHSGLLKNLLHVLNGESFETFDWNLYDEFRNNCDFVII